MDELKKLLGDELYNQVVEKLGDKKIAIVSDGNWFPKDKFDAVNNDKNTYKKQIDDLNIELGKLQVKLKDNDDASETIEGLKKQIQDKETELVNIRKANAIKLEALKANPNDVADIIPHLKQDVITVSENGTVTGLSEQLEALKESKPYLFKEVEPKGTGGSKGAGFKGKKESAGDSIAQKLIEQRKQQAENVKSAEDIYFK